MYYFRNRWYDPALARFPSPDPLGLGGGINPYVFAGNDPVNRTDPFGLDGHDCPDCVGEFALELLVANGKRSPGKDPCARGACYPRGTGGGATAGRPVGGAGEDGRARTRKRQKRKREKSRVSRITLKSTAE